MSQRGRGSGPHDDDRDGDEAEPERRSPEPPASRPIAPYDPYRSSTSDASRRSSRTFDEDPLASPVRRPSRLAGNDPFLPDDDPLSAEAWQLDLDEVDVFDEPAERAPREVDVDEAPPPRRPRRQPPAMKSGRAVAAGAGTRRAPRRIDGGGASRTRAPRPSVSLGVPRAVAGSSLVADPGALLLLAINLGSVLLMVLILAVRVGGLPNPIVLRLDPAGNPDWWGPPRVLWRLPLIAFGTTLMFLVAAWFLHPLDRFAARFALGAAIVAQIVAWVAIAQHLFAA